MKRKIEGPLRRGLKRWFSSDNFVKLVEVGPRDGLQNEKQTLSTEFKVKLIDKLALAGFRSVEVTSFVSPKWVPQMADAAEVYQTISKLSGVEYPVLVPNLKGLEAAMEIGVKDISVFVSASEAFSKKNINCTIDESLIRIGDVMTQARGAKMSVRGYISCCFGCPYEGEVSPTRALEIAKKLLEMGCYEIAISDTIGVGTPGMVDKLLDVVCAQVPIDQLALHLHDTYGMALPNILRGIDRGVRTFDSSISGLGGCPFAKGATGNVATEDVLYMVHGLGLETGVDEKMTHEASQFVSETMNRPAQRQLKRSLKN